MKFQKTAIVLNALALCIFEKNSECMLLSPADIQEAKKEMQALTAQLNRPLQTGAQGSIPTLKLLATQTAIKNFEKQLPRHNLQPQQTSLKTIGVVSRAWDQWLKLFQKQTGKEIPPGVIQILVDEFAQANRWHLPIEKLACYTYNHDCYSTKKHSKIIKNMTEITPNNKLFFFDNKKQIECLPLHEYPGVHSYYFTQRHLLHDAKVEAFCLTSNNKIISSDCNNFYIWNLCHGRDKELERKVPKLVHDDTTITTLSPLGTYAYVYSPNPTYKLLYNLMTGRAYPCTLLGKYSVFTSDNHCLVSEYPKGLLSLFCVQHPGKISFVCPLVSHTSMNISALAASKNIVACGTRDGFIRGWHLSNPEELLFLLQIPQSCLSAPHALELSISTDERYITSKDIDSTMYLWDLADQNNPLVTSNNCKMLCISPDRTLLIAVDVDGSFDLFKRKINTYSSLAAVLFDMLLNKYLDKYLSNPVCFQMYVIKLCSSCWYDQLPIAHKKMTIATLKQIKHFDNLTSRLERKIQD